MRANAVSMLSSKRHFATFRTLTESDAPEIAFSVLSLQIGDQY